MHHLGIREWLLAAAHVLQLKRGSASCQAQHLVDMHTIVGIECGQAGGHEKTSESQKVG